MVETVSRPTTGSKTHVQYRNGAGRKSRTGKLTPEQQAIASERQRWETQTAAGSLTKLPGRLPTEHSPPIGGEPMERIYPPAALHDFDYGRARGFPGESPFTRGVHPPMYRSRFWTMRMFAGFGSAEETNRR